MKNIQKTWLSLIIAVFICACSNDTGMIIKGEPAPYIGVWFGEIDTQAWITERWNNGKYRQFMKIIIDYKKPPVYIELEGAWSVTATSYIKTVEKTNDPTWLGKTFTFKLAENYDSNLFSYYFNDGGEPLALPIKEARRPSFNKSKIERIKLEYTSRHKEYLRTGESWESRSARLLDQGQTNKP